MAKTKDFDGVVYFVDLVKNEVGLMRKFPDVRTFGKRTMPLGKSCQGLSYKN
jgi:hypothetical protein